MPLPRRLVPTLITAAVAALLATSAAAQAQRPNILVISDQDERLDFLEREFIKLILSKQGQQVVVKDGYVPLPASVAAEDLAKIK